MKHYLYCALLAPSLMLAQDPFSLKEQCASFVAKQNLKAQEDQSPELKLPVHILDLNSQAMVDFQSKKLILGPQLEKKMVERLNEEVRKLYDAQTIRILVEAELNIALRNKKLDQLTGFGYWYEGFQQFERTLANGTHQTIVGPAGCQEYDDFLDTLPEKLKKAPNTQLGYLAPLDQYLCVTENNGKVSLAVTDLKVVLYLQSKLDEFTQKVFNETNNND